VPSAYIFIIIPSIPDLKSDLYTGIKILDVGCGSGLLMIQLAKAFPNCSFVGIDVVSFAIEDAQQNIEDNSVGDRVSA
jgi:methylase of polypeptide subunit release factors